MKKQSKNAVAVTLTLKPLPPGTPTPKGHIAAYAVTLPEGIVGVVQGGKTARQVLLISAWAPKTEKSAAITAAFE